MAVADPRQSSARAKSHRLAGEHLVLAARASSDPSNPRFMMAIPKKLVPSSPVRNLIRRVIRESHRAACGPHRELFTPWSVRIQLAKLPQDPEAPTANARGQALRPFRRRPVHSVLKRRLRAEADDLIRRFARRLAGAGNANANANVDNAGVIGQAGGS